jgi:xanthine dehydrogenase accessory factor
VDHFQDFLSMVIGQSDQKFALATVIRVEGSAYRHEGAKLLVSESGKLFGIISGGCLEEDVRYRALALMSSGISEVASYDLRSEDDLGWGQGAGCNGKIDVLIEPFYWSNQKGFTSEKLLFLKEKLDEGKKIGLLRWVSGPDHLKDQVIFF